MGIWFILGGFSYPNLFHSWPERLALKVSKKIIPPKKLTWLAGKSLYSLFYLGDTTSNGWFSIVMLLVFRILSCREQDQVVWAANVDRVTGWTNPNHRGHGWGQVLFLTLDLCATELSQKISSPLVFLGPCKVTDLLRMNFWPWESLHCSPNPGHDQEQPFLERQWKV